MRIGNPRLRAPGTPAIRFLILGSLVLLLVGGLVAAWPGSPAASAAAGALRRIDHSAAGDPGLPTLTAQSAGPPAGAAVAPGHPAGLGPMADVTGPKKVVVLRVHFDDYAASSRYTKAQVEGFFGQLDTLWRNTSYNKITIVSVVSDLYELPDNRTDYVDDFDDGDLSNGGKFDKVLIDAIDNAPAGLDWNNVDAVMVVMAETSAAQFHRGQATSDCNLRMGPGGPIKHVGCAIFSENPSDGDIRIWGRWAHEMGHAFQQGGPAHPSNYDNPFELMDANYPGQVGAFEKQAHTGYPGWLPVTKYQIVRPNCSVGPAPCTGVGGDTVALWAIEYDPAGKPNVQAAKAYVTGNLYYLVSVRRKVLGDELNGFYSPNGIPDEGVLIERVSEGSDKWVEVKGKGGDRDNLWNEGDTYSSVADGITINIGKKTDDDNYQVTIRYTQNANQPDVMMNPWTSPPGNTWETTDIWIDSPLNGYGTFRYGTWDDGSGNLVPRGNGDDPAIGQVNRIYARVRNIGGSPASNVTARFEITDPPGQGIAGANGWAALGNVSQVQFPGLATINPGAYTDVYIEWTPNFPLSAEDLAAGRFAFHTCLRVKLDAVAGESVLGNQDGDREQENISYFQAPPTVAETRIYSDVIRLRNDDVVNKKYFHLSYKSDLPADWDLDINGGVLGLELLPGELISIPIRIRSGSSGGAGSIYGVDVQASSQRVLVNSKNPKDTHIEFKPLGGVRVEARALDPTKIACEAIRNAQGQVFVRGQLDGIGRYYDEKRPPIVGLEGAAKGILLPATLVNARVAEDGSFAGYLGQRSATAPDAVVCFFAGTDKLMSAATRPVPIKEAADAGRVAYVFNTDLAGRDSFRSLLEGRGFAVDLVPITGTATFDFSRDLAIILGNDTGGGSVWGTSAGISRINSSGKPIVGVGKGGYAFFGRLGLDIGYPNGWHDPSVSFGYARDPGQAIYSSPYPVTVPISRQVELYARGPETVEIYLPGTPPAGVLPIVRDPTDLTHWPILAEDKCYLLWGYHGSPATMTEAGRNLFVNSLFFQSCSSIPTATPTASPTREPTRTPTATPTGTREATRTPTVTATHQSTEPSRTPTPTATHQSTEPTRTPTPSATTSTNRLIPVFTTDRCTPNTAGGRLITFEDLANATAVTDQYAALGVHFVANDATTPLIYGDPAGERTTISPRNSLTNDAVFPRASNNVPLAFFFDVPQRFVGVYLGNGDASFPPTATIRAYDAGGLIGSVAIPVNSNDVNTFIGVVDTGAGIKRIEIDYGDTARSEEIDNLCFPENAGALPTRTTTPIATDRTPTPTPTGTVRAIHPPRVYTIAPERGGTNERIQARIGGESFQPGAKAALIRDGKVFDLPSLFASEYVLEGVIPSGLEPGRYAVRVTNPDGQADTLADAYLVLGDGSVLVGISPNHGAADAPTEVTIRGRGFTDGILIGLLRDGRQIALQDLRVVSGEEIRAIVPAGLAPGTYDLVLSRPPTTAIGAQGDEPHLLAQAFTIVSPQQTDLAIGEEDIWTDPTAIRAGMRVSLGVNLHRLGGMQTIPGVPVAFYLGDPSAGGTLISQTTSLPVPPGQTEAVSIPWDLAAVSGTVKVFVLIDPGNTISETTKVNNRAARAITILPRDAADTVPPTIQSLLLNGGAQVTTAPRISVTLKATDPSPSSGLGSLLLVEREYNASARLWVPISTTGWISYSEAFSLTLTDRAGLRFVQAYVADAAGNISTDIVRQHINYVPPTDSLRASQARIYRFRLGVGQSLRFTTTPASGDPDLYLWGPGGTLLASSKADGTAPDEVSVVATAAGIYQIEVRAFSDTSFGETVQHGAGGGGGAGLVATSLGASETKPDPTAPIVSLSIEPEGREAVPNAPVTNTETAAAGDPFRTFLPVIVRATQGGGGW